MDKEGSTIEDLMGEDELIQEVKGQNPKLVEYISRPQNLKILFNYILNPGQEEPKAFKYPFLAAEIFGCEIFTICEAVLKNLDMLKEFWALLDRPAPLPPLQANYFVKVNIVLLSKKTADMIQFLRSQDDAVTRLLKHVGTSAISDLILKLISLDELPEGQGVIHWLSSQGLIAHLISQLDPKNTPEMHSNASQTLMDIITVSFPPQQMDPTMTGPPEPSPTHLNSVGNQLVDEMKSEALLRKMIGYMVDRDSPYSTSSLANGINIVMELFRRYCSEIEQAELQYHEYQVQLQSNHPARQLPTQEKLAALAVDLNDLFKVIGETLPSLTSFLTQPKGVTGPVDTTLGKQTPLGSERLKICELFAEVLHLQYLFTSSPLFDLLVLATNEVPGNYGIADGLMFLSDRFVEEKIMPKCIDLFFEFKWNNFLHSVVYDMVAKVLNTFTYTSTLPANPVNGPIPSNEDLPALSDVSTVSQTKLKALRKSVKTLVVTIFKEGRLTAQIVNAQRQNDYEVEQPKGVRLGYMGHLTYISDEVCKLFEKCAAELDDELHAYITSEEWQDYVSHALQETRDRDRQTLGGARPDVSYTQQSGGGVPGGDELASSSSKPIERSSRNADDDYVPNPNENEAYNDQFARYLTQQLVKDIPDRFLGADSSDEEDSVADEWIQSIQGKEVDFDMGEALASEQRKDDDETVSDDIASELASSRLEDQEKPSDEPKPALSASSSAVTEQEDWADFSKAPSE
ncbi:SIT4 phosphatase-associated protein-domain-containing protein [Gorgonomyces haynaldii]|nr:SIT4 phosphatase-associated protein-domain-containing protein [Gorgonomyces haynaldii]